MGITVTDDRRALCPRTVSTVQAGLRWLLEVEQPADAADSHHGQSRTVSGVAWMFVPSGHDGLPVVAASVVDPATVPRDGRWVIVNPLPADMLERMTETLTGLGAEVSHTWNGGPAAGTASVALTRTAHPTLLAAVARYRTGCQEPDHGPPSVFCRCPWFRDMSARLVLPRWPQRPQGCGRAEALKEHRP